MSVYKLDPPIKNYIWGGTRLRDSYGKKGDAPLAESWELSFHPDGLTKLADGTSLKDALSSSVLGKNCDSFDEFPLLVKLIDAAKHLSVQVHPSDAYALKNENSYGKTEMWYIVEASEGAGIYLGFQRETLEAEIRDAIARDALEELLNFIPVSAGECYFIPAGTVHAIGAGCLICEVQQNSNLTYRLYDYGRKDTNGFPRPLHIEKALAVMERVPYRAPAEFLPIPGERTLGISRYFHTSLLSVSGERAVCADDTSFLALFCVKGEGKVGDVEIVCGDSVLVPAGTGEVLLHGDAVFISVSVRKYTLEVSENAVTVRDDLGRVHVREPIENEKEPPIEAILSKYALTKEDVEKC